MRSVVLWVTMILQLDVSPLGSFALGFHAVSVRGDAGVYEEREMDQSGRKCEQNDQTRLYRRQKRCEG